MRSFTPVSFARIARAPAVALGAVALILGALVPFSGCSLSSVGTGGLPGPPCASDLDCEDNNGCTETYCSPAKTCASREIPGAAPDDQNPCTVDHCEGVTAIYEAIADGAACTEGLGNGTCQGGQCDISCTPFDAMTRCDDEEPCTLDSCAEGKCARTKLHDVESPGVLAVPGDCQVHRCVEGVSTRIIKDDDLPVDMVCVDEACNMGLPSTDPSPINTPCGDGTLHCNGDGACVGCTSPMQCPSTECTQAVCSAEGECSTTPLMDGTPLDEQLPDDCVILECDGMGGVKSSTPNPAETPPSDMLDCTLDLCVAGAAEYTDLTGTPCAMGGTICKEGLCVECLAPGTCPDVDPLDCLLPACSLDGECGTGPRDPGSICTSGGGAVCDTDGNCVQCNVDTDCAIPTDPCKVRDCVNEVCVPADAADTTPCPGGACQGGVCKLAAGLPCGGPEDCMSGQCPADDGVCCATACNAICKTCATGTCLDVGMGLDPDDDCSVAGMLNCNGNGMCGP